MNLKEVLLRLDDFDDDQTIYVANVDVGGETSAVVDYESYEGDVPESANGMRYFLEVSIAKDAIRVWSEWRKGERPTVDQMVDAVKYYADNDAFIPSTLSKTAARNDMPDGER